MNLRQKIMHYLASGVQASEVATLVGCSPGYISQLKNEDDFKAELLTLVTDAPLKQDEIQDNQYDAVEATLLKTIRDGAPGAEFRDAVRALEVVAKIKDMKANRKNPMLTPGANVVQNIIQLTLPAGKYHAEPVVALNDKSEILSIEGQSLAPLSSDGVKNLFARMREKQQLDATIVSEI